MIACQSTAFLKYINFFSISICKSDFFFCFYLINRVIITVKLTLNLLKCIWNIIYKTKHQNLVYFQEKPLFPNTNFIFGCSESIASMLIKFLRITHLTLGAEYNVKKSVTSYYVVFLLQHIDFPKLNIFSQIYIFVLCPTVSMN